jgi:hypothetical protein
VLNRARWSPLPLSRRLLGLLGVTWLAPAAPLVLLVDGTLERRSGRRIAAQGRCSDAVRSRPGHLVTSAGVHWLWVRLLVPVAWSRRPWALPFLSVPTLTPAASAALGQRQRTVPERTATLVRLLRRWPPARELVLVGDRSFADVELAQTGRQQRMRLVAPLLLHAQLYDPPAPRPASTPGPKPKPGQRHATLAARAAEPATAWPPVPRPWSGGRPRPVGLATGTARWHTDGQAPVPLRWVLVRRPDRRRGPLAFCCPDLTAAPERIVGW